uniref:TSPY n=2 Tax=Equus TaxID=9789 RepID=A0A9L0JMH7_EQUAS
MPTPCSLIGPDPRAAPSRPAHARPGGPTALRMRLLPDRTRRMLGERSGPAGVAGSAVRVAAAPVGMAEEVNVLGVEAVREAEALGATEQAGLGREVRLLVEDMMEVVEVVEEPEEKPEQQGQEEPGRGPTTARPPLEALEALQLELSSVNARARRAYSRLKRKNSERRKLHLDRRGAIIQSIPGFWAKAILNHPQMSAMISEQDEDMLSYMMDLKVEEVRHPSDCCKIMLFFRKNPYFWNKVIIKEYLIDITGKRRLPGNYERKAYSRRHDNCSLNFFNWFSGHNFAGSSRIAEIISEDLWPNPLQYYTRETEITEGCL